MFLYSHWLNLSIPTRIKIAREFGIEKKGQTHVEDNKVKSDGYHLVDIEKNLNVDSIKGYLETNETSMSVLWTMLIDKMEGRMKVPDTVIIVTKGLEVAPQPLEVKPIKHARIRRTKAEIERANSLRDAGKAGQEVR